MKNERKAIKTIAAALLLAYMTTLTSCDVMLGMLGGMAMGLSSYNLYGYSSSYGTTNNNYLLDPNYAIWQTQQQQAQMNQVQQQLINQSIQQTNRDMEELNRVNQQLIETSIWQAEQGINLGGTENSGNQGGYTPTSTPTQQKTHQCGLCGGSGEVTDDTTNPSFGNTKYCDKCRKTVPSGHFHKRCPSCDGKGYW